MCNVLRLILLLHTFFVLINAELNPYCNLNETSISYRPVIKTRLVRKPPSGKLKFLKRTRLITEEYVDREKVVSWKLVHKCCEGFEMSEFNICEPQCTPNCGEHQKCIEPNVCACNNDFARCITPPSATTSEPEEPEEPKGIESTTAEDWTSERFGEDVLVTVSSVSMDEVTIKKLIKKRPTTTTVVDDLTTADMTTTVTKQSTTTTTQTTPIPTNVTDCRLKACAAHAQCAKNGTCVCETGFVMDAVKAICLPNKKISNLEIKRNLSNKKSPSLLVILLIALGVACGLCALGVFIFFILLKKRNRCGTLSIKEQHKNYGYCRYEKESICDGEDC